MPLPPNLANSRMHWRVKLAQRQRYELALDGLLHAGQLPAPPVTPLPRCTVTVHLQLGAAMDDDNAVARCKWALDWVVKRGYVQDDKRRHLTWGAFPTQHVTRKHPPGLTLTLHPVA